MPVTHEAKFKSVEEKGTNALEMAQEENAQEKESPEDEAEVVRITMPEERLSLFKLRAR